jgi:CRISPR-associated protein Cas2
VAELVTFVVYDIPDDRTRLRIANVCKDYGLEHIQYSVFCGPLDPTRRDDMFARLEGTLAGEAGHIMVIPVCEKDIQAKRELVRAS